MRLLLDTHVLIWFISNKSMLSAEIVEKLPWHHKDPFDRMLIAQAICDDLVLISHDHSFAKYSLPTLFSM